MSDNPNLFKKYLAYVVFDFKETFIYRFNMAIWMLVDVIVPFIMIFVWIAVFQTNDKVQTFSAGSMVTYYLVANFVMVATTPNMEWPILNMIKSGQLSFHLTRPIDFFWRAVWGTAASNIITVLIYLPILGIALIYFHPYISDGNIIVERIPLFLFTLVVTYFMNCGLKMILGTLAFWLVDSWGIFSAYKLIAQILAGSLIPLVLLPENFQLIANYLPFKMLITFPVYMLLGILSVEECYFNLMIEILWMVGLLVAARLFWSLGLRRYEAVGG
ncbi:ABC transporter permease [Paenibacillus woosongensis]|uniref:ABC transporter permease n=1 Tax=Paenibacillus woosongensis TaxID=307580 RepID=A0A7X2Z0C5_9BACL|nr:ABC-2 family transporter protein [Paenibacillus woosongensis]MUG45279.1 hypothetical protein [Paenibacillus woosongensis]